MKQVDRKKARARAEAMDKLKKDLRNGVITKTKAKIKWKKEHKKN